jgi:ABC-type Fe3+ transport system substrate-binding protein
VVSTTGFYGYLLKKRGLLAAYDSPERKYFRDGFKDPQGFWTSNYTTYGVFGFNTKLVSKANIPRSHEDLLKPAWKGQVGIESRAYEWFTATIAGKEKGPCALAAQQQPARRQNASGATGCRRRVQRRLDFLHAQLRHPEGRRSAGGVGGAPAKSPSGTFR